MVLGAYSLGLVTLNVILAHMCGVQFLYFPICVFSGADTFGLVTLSVILD